MTVVSIRQVGAWAVAAGLCCIVMMGTPAIAEDKMTVQSLIDRQLILDQITRYYYNFGRETKIPESSFYAEDGALILGTRRFEGRAAVQSAYGGGARPAPAGWRGTRCSSRENPLQHDGRQCTDLRARRQGDLAGHLYRIPAGEEGRSGEDDGARQGVRHMGQSETASGCTRSAMWVSVNHLQDGRNRERDFLELEAPPGFEPGMEPDDARFSLLFGRSCSEVAPKAYRCHSSHAGTRLAPGELSRRMDFSTTTGA